jgi:spore maturation protein CgeB
VRFALFYHSLISDWNHGNAHFLRGVACELLKQGHGVEIFEPADGWSLTHLMAEHGPAPIQDFHDAYPQLHSTLYDLKQFDLDRALDHADVVIVHEWSEPSLVSRIGACRRKSKHFKLLFHDTHHRALSAPHELERLDLRDYDGVLAFGEVLREIYLQRDWAARAWTWHEAADTTRFTPRLRQHAPSYDLTWIGNWGDGERSDEIQQFLIEPVRALQMRACVYGVRYPEHALHALESAGIQYAGWVPNFRVPEAFADAAMTVHIPRRFYTQSLPGVPTIRIFEALACGIPLVSAPWTDSEHLFEPGRDYLVARNTQEMRDQLQLLRSDGDLAQSIAAHGLRTILSRHTCAHRARELLNICDSLRAPLRRSA